MNDRDSIGDDVVVVVVDGDNNYHSGCLVADGGHDAWIWKRTRKRLDSTMTLMNVYLATRNHSDASCAANIGGDEHCSYWVVDIHLDLCFHKRYIDGIVVEAGFAESGDYFGRIIAVVVVAAALDNIVAVARGDN